MFGVNNISGSCKHFHNKLLTRRFMEDEKIMKKMWLPGSRLTPSCWCDLPSEETQNIRLIRADGQITVTNSYQASYTLTQRWGWHHQRGNSHQNCSYNYFLPLYILYNYMYILLIYTTNMNYNSNYFTKQGSGECDG